MPFKSRLPVFENLGFRPEAIPTLERYLELLWTANTELNLVSRKMTFDELIDNHVIDCLLPLSHFPADVNAVADFGTGGGLPAVIYAIQFPQIRFEVFEKSKLKQEFLRKTHALAPNLNVNAEIPPRLPQVQLITARAFKPIDVILDLSREHLNRGGEYFLLKGRREKIDEELKASSKLLCDHPVQVIPLHSPVLEVERHLVRIGAARV